MSVHPGASGRRLGYVAVVFLGGERREHLLAGTVARVPALDGARELVERHCVDLLRREPYCSAGPVEMPETEPIPIAELGTGAGFPGWSPGTPITAAIRI